MTGAFLAQGQHASAVMTGLVPVIHVVKLPEIWGLAGSVPAWMAGTSPAMTELAPQTRARNGDFVDAHSMTISA
jgi:hypothetical protein